MTVTDGGALQVKAAVHARLLDHGDADAVNGDSLREMVREASPLLGGAVLERVVDELLAEVTGLGPLEPLLADPAVTDVLVNGDGSVWVERAGALSRTSLSLDARLVTLLIQRIVAPLGLRADRASPLVDARLPDGSRANAVVPPLAVDGPCLTIRRFGATTLPLAAFAPADVADLLRSAVADGRNLVVSGATGAGKTTLLNALAACVPAGERIVTIEDAAELRLPQPHVVRLEARPANAEGAGEVTIRRLVRNALRMRPDRIVVGEVRGGEALDMVLAMNTGHDGSLSTIHANSPADALRRLETLVLMSDVDLPLAAVREQVASSVDWVVQVARTGEGRRAVVAVAEVVGDAGLGGPWQVHVLADDAGVRSRPVRPPRRTSR